MLTVLRVKNPRHTAHQSLIDMDVLFAEFAPEWLPYSAEQGNTEGNGDDLYSRALAGAFGPIAPYVAPEPVIIVPATITKRQACLHLLALELYDDVVALIQSAGKAATIEWETTSIIARDNPLMASIQLVLGWSGEQVDEFFINANSIT